MGARKETGRFVLSLVAVLVAGGAARAQVPDVTGRNFTPPDLRGDKRGADNFGLVLPPPPYIVKTAPFRVLDQMVGPYANFNNVPFSPVAVSQAGTFLAAVNPHANLVRVFDISAPNPVNWHLVSSIKTAWGPTSCAFWESPQCQPELLVTCSNSDSLLWLSYGGRVQGLLGVPGEPSDLLVDAARDVAWVSCMAEDLVIEVDLVQKRILERYVIPSKHPAFLSFETGATGDVLVAPMHSGNNTTVERGGDIFRAGPNGILDLSAAPKGLPDEDLFRLVAGTGKVEPVVTRAGTVLFSHGTNPATGDVWMLGTDAHNVALQSEPEARGVFSENRLALATGLPVAGGAPVQPFQVIDLDDSDAVMPGVQYDPTRTVGQPWALAFDSAGNGFVAGMLTDNVTMLTSAGAFVKEWNVGPIPRGLTFVTKGTNEYLAVYCWGASRIDLYLPAVGTGRVASLHLGADPAPPEVRAGRRVYYSAAHSLHNNQSCNTCHVDGFSDMIAWDLSDRRKDAFGQHTVGVDDKGPLMTQTLRSIAGQQPYHWRGERGDLIDFNGAFDALLGAPPLDTTPGGDFDKFQAFVFSLTERANPFESPRRIVSDKIIPDTFAKSTSAVRGQDVFWDFPSLAGSSCQECHQLPSGTGNDVFRDEADATEASGSHFKVAALSSFWRKLQPTRVQVELTPGVFDTLPVLGGSLSHTGLAADLQDFVTQAAFTLGNQAKEDAAAFLMQLDTGVPPLMHEGVRIGYGSECDTGLSPAVLAPWGAAAPGASLPLAPAFAVVAPQGTTAAAAQELAANAEKIALLESRVEQDSFDLVVIAELLGVKVEGLYDAAANVYELADVADTPVPLDKSHFLDALVDEDLVGMLFPVPRGMGAELTAYDPLSGPPPVEPGPGPSGGPGTPIDPDDGDDGDGGTGGTGTGGTNPLVAAPAQGTRGPAAANVSAPAGPPVHASGNGPMVSEFRVVYATRSVAKLVFFTDVPARTTTQVTPEGGSMREQTEPRSARAHMIFVRGLDPGTTHDLNLLLVGASGTSEYPVDDAFTTRDYLAPADVRVSALSARAPDQDSGGTLRFTFDLTAHQLSGDPAVAHFPVIDVLVWDAANDAWRVDQDDVVVAATDAAGDTFHEVIASGLSAGDVVLVRVADVDSPSTPNYVWSFADTAPEHRLLEATYTGTGP